MPSVYAFPFRKAGPGRRRAYRPMISARLWGPRGRSSASMLVDSGADFAVIGPGLARKLGLAEEDVRTGRGISARVPVWRSRMVVEVRHPSGLLPPIEVPVELMRWKSPPFPVLGRGGFFEAFDILFRLGPVPERGMFYLSPQDPPGVGRVRRRAAARSEHRRRGVAG